MPHPPQCILFYYIFIYDLVIHLFILYVCRGHTDEAKSLFRRCTMFSSLGDLSDSR